MGIAYMLFLIARRTRGKVALSQLGSDTAMEVVKSQQEIMIITELILLIQRIQKWSPLSWKSLRKTWAFYLTLFYLCFFFSSPFEI